MSGQLHHVAVGTGRPLVVLHGGKLDHRHMADALEPVLSACPGWRRLYLDLPGCGKSQGFDAIQCQDDVLAAVAGFIEEACQGEPCAVIGESRGAYLAQGLGHAHAGLLAGLALIVPGGLTAAAKAKLPAHRTMVADPELLAGLNPALRQRAEWLVVQRPEIVEKIERTKLPAAALLDAALEARLQDRFLFSFHEAMQAGSFDKPALIVSGRQDAIAGTADALASLACYPRATYGLLDTAGHFLAWERPEVFQALVADWLDRVAAEAG